MDLWVRSQDRKKLEKIDNRFRVQETSVNPHSHWWGVMVDGQYFAEYNSEERALEVLDEIQDLFITRETFKTEFTKDGLTMMNKQPSSVVYEMPEE